ncbi:hypothetical protein Tco_1274795 [Tanacetum coccineum]
MLVLKAIGLGLVCSEIVPKVLKAIGPCGVRCEGAAVRGLGPLCPEIILRVLKAMDQVEYAVKRQQFVDLDHWQAYVQWLKCALMVKHARATKDIILIISIECGVFKFAITVCGVGETGHVITGLEVGSIRRIQWVGYGVLEFLGVGTAFDIFHNIHILYLQYNVLTSSGYDVLSFIPLWSLVRAGTDTPYLP